MSLAPAVRGVRAGPGTPARGRGVGRRPVPAEPRPRREGSLIGPFIVKSLTTPIDGVPRADIVAIRIRLSSFAPRDRRGCGPDPGGEGATRGPPAR